jgi:osmoprotectant transport system ATP-binding protein
MDTADLEKHPVLAPEDDVSDARRTLAAAGARWAVVLDPSQGVLGWVSLDQLDGDGTVKQLIKPADAHVYADATLKTAMAELLQHDAGWIAVLEPGSDRYLGVLTPSSLHAALRRSVDLTT